MSESRISAACAKGHHTGCTRGRRANGHNAPCECECGHLPNWCPVCGHTLRKGWGCYCGERLVNEILARRQAAQST
jgi:hypothetical protein